MHRLLCDVRRLRRYIIVGFVLSFGTSAPLSAQPAIHKPDDDWRDLETLLTAAIPKNAGKRTPAQLAAEREQNADRLQQAAQAAKNFYTKHPTDAKAAQARKTEVTASLASVRLGKTALEEKALDLAKSYRANKSELRENRFEVALAADHLALEKRRRDKARQDTPQDFEAMADGLRKEFGDIPETHGLYIGLAEDVDMHAANRLATKLLEMRPPPRIKAAAQVITARYGLLGEPLRLRLTRIDHSTFELPATPAPDGPTVLYIWSAGPDETNPFAALSALKGKISREVRWVYVGLRTSPSRALAVQSKTPFAGTHCIDDGGPRSSLAQRLKVRVFPMVFVLDRKGTLTGYGRVDELPALLAAAQR